MVAGQTVIGAGVRLGATQLGALAAAGVARVACARRPRVAVIATGSELVPPGTPLGPGQVYEANALMLDAALAETGAEVERLPSVADDEAAHRTAIERGLEADILVTSGGVSVGPHDLVRRIEAELGVVEVFWRVAVRPGKPVSFGVRGATLVFGLPGNPVSSLVGCELFVKPALRAFLGLPDPLPRYEHGRLVSALRRSAERDEFVRTRARDEGDGVVLEPLSGQDSHMIVRAAARTRSSASPAATACSRQAPSSRSCASRPRRHRHELRVDDVPVRREEARMARLQLELLVVRRP